MRAIFTRARLCIAAVIAAIVALLLMRGSQVLGAGAAAVVAVGLLAEAWRRDD